MNKLNVPAGYQAVMPYLIVENATGFSRFLTTVFNATEKEKHMRDEKTIMHAEAQIGGSVIMFADSTETWKPMSASMFVYVEDADETYKIALAEGSTSVMEPADQPYGRSCGVTDPFGNTWWITSVK
ncbi:VOC family protein [Adhaeribacter soli]|uniref:VOC family protein n=1 Tax=Adhaeribacter soli TaxID=2607655 RepID=A0A5N1IP82_9BACT|nr:VOC family protein [Adhaeribacter soli]KAA9331771.1 VOC family protein [Adhaeribacter soli]